MKLEKALEILKENKKIKHKTWDSLIIEEITGNVVILKNRELFCLP